MEENGHFFEHRAEGNPDICHPIECTSQRSSDNFNMDIQVHLNPCSRLSDTDTHTTPSHSSNRSVEFTGLTCNFSNNRLSGQHSRNMEVSECRCINSYRVGKGERNGRPPLRLQSSGETHFCSTASCINHATRLSPEAPSPDYSDSGSPLAQPLQTETDTEVKEVVSTA